jgi:hypothetical protein
MIVFNVNLPGEISPKNPLHVVRQLKAADLFALPG